MPDTLSIPAALIYTMVMVSAADAAMTDAELSTIGDMVKHMPAFRGFDPERLLPVASACAAVLADENGMEQAIDRVKSALSPALRETALSLAWEVALAQDRVTPTERRLLAVLEQRLEIDGLMARIIETATRIRHRA